MKTIKKWQCLRLPESKKKIARSNYNMNISQLSKRRQLMRIVHFIWMHIFLILFFLFIHSVAGTCWRFNNSKNWSKTRYSKSKEWSCTLRVRFNMWRSSTYSQWILIRYHMPRLSCGFTTAHHNFVFYTFSVRSLEVEISNFQSNWHTISRWTIFSTNENLKRNGRQFNNCNKNNKNWYMIRLH